MKKLHQTITALIALPFLSGGLYAGSPSAQNFSSLEDLQESLPQGQTLLFSGEYLPEVPQDINTAFRHQIGMSFDVEEGTELLGFVVYLAEDLPERERDWSLRLWRFGDAMGEITQTTTETNLDGEEIEVEETIETLITQKTGNRPYGSSFGNRTTEGSLAVQSNPSSGAFSAGDLLVVRLAEPVAATYTANFWYGFSISVDDGNARIYRAPGNPNPDRLNGFEQLNSNTWRSAMGGGDRIIKFDVIVATEAEEGEPEEEEEEEEETEYQEETED